MIISFSPVNKAFKYLLPRMLPLHGTVSVIFVSYSLKIGSKYVLFRISTYIFFYETLFSTYFISFTSSKHSSLFLATTKRYTEFTFAETLSLSELFLCFFLSTFFMKWNIKLNGGKLSVNTSDMFATHRTSEWTTSRKMRANASSLEHTHTIHTHTQQRLWRTWGRLCALCVFVCIVVPSKERKSQKNCYTKRVVRTL